jgi:redox-sensitive bicupin YhaK (pirin superfamily)
MKKIVHRAGDRGLQDHGWLKAAHSFSFANYYEPTKMHFGLLRVLNDDIIAPGMGFGMHSHDNMEIVTIPLKGKLAHKDSLGSEGVITSGEVQMMSAGSGIRHSEFNASSTEEVNLLQIWVFPKNRNIEPRYDQMKYDTVSKEDQIVTLVTAEEEANTLWINQDAVFSIGDFSAGSPGSYQLKFRGNGVYLFLIEGEIDLAGDRLHARDAAGIWDTSVIDFKSTTASKVLIIEIPME